MSVKSPKIARMVTSDSGYPLITRERTEKLELLNHLITNLAHAIVVCGPEGVGKTRLLKGFQEASQEAWILCSVQGDFQLTLEKIQELLSKAITQDMPNFAFRSLANAFDRLAGSETKIVLVIDDAGQLVPGLIEELLAFADGKPVLRIVFALTHSELYIKNGSDPAIDDCYQIEIPTLTEPQCGEFLEYLSTLHKHRVQFNAINESMITELYRETHGIPGSILAHLPTADGNEKSDYSKAILIVAVVGLVLLALGVQWWSSKPKIKAVVATNGEANQNGSANIQQPTITAQENQRQATTQSAANSVPQALQKPAENLEKGGLTGIRDDVIDSKRSDAFSEEGSELGDMRLQTPSLEQSLEKVNHPQANDVAQPANEELASSQVQIDTSVILDADGRWLKEQPIENFTLQLMALSNEQTALEVMQRHQALVGNLKCLKTKTRRGKDRFVLLYGSFSSPEQANSEKALLPKELQKTWLRKVSAVQGEIDVATQTQIQTDTPE